VNVGFAKDQPFTSFGKLGFALLVDGAGLFTQLRATPTCVNWSSHKWELGDIPALKVFAPDLSVGSKLELLSIFGAKRIPKKSMKNKKQHYIPVSYQRGFAEGYPENIRIKANDLSIYLFDRETKEAKRKGVVNAFQYPHYYSIIQDEGDPDTSIEEAFSHNESNMARLSEILFREHITKVDFRCRLLESKQAKEALAYCIHLQLKRVPKYLRKTEAFLRDSGKFEGKNVVHNWKNLSMADIGEGNHGYPPFYEFFLKKNWTLHCILDSRKKFISSDAPVSFYNTTGLAKDEIEIWFPINQKILLHIYGPGTNVKMSYLIPHKHASHNGMIDYMNTNIAQQADKYFFSSSDVFLKSIAKRVNFDLKFEYV
jgi:hypothetical protein